MHVLVMIADSSDVKDEEVFLPIPPCSVSIPVCSGARGTVLIPGCPLPVVVVVVVGGGGGRAGYRW